MSIRSKHPRPQIPSSSSSSSSSSRTVVLELLEEQCARLSTLYNATETATRGKSSSLSLSSSSPNHGGILREVERLEAARTRVRSNFLRLLNDPSAVVAKHPGLRRHLALSERVVGTIASNGSSWHANGLPAPPSIGSGGSSNNNNNPLAESLRSNTVAIAALKASVARIRAIEGE
eukprot:jgi/Psemu1/8118/gm1.8118_g